MRTSNHVGKSIRNRIIMYVLRTYRHHAVHDEEDEQVVPDHDVPVQLKPALLRAETVKHAT